MDPGIWSESIDYKTIALGLATLTAYPLYRAWDARTQRQERLAFSVDTAMDDLDALGSRSSHATLTGSAVVVGGSITGLLAAAVCANRFERVVIIEADEGADTDFPATATKSKKYSYGNSSYVSRRPRVAQSFEVHVYQPFALLTLRRLIPDFDRKFIAAGGRIKPWNFNALWYGIKVGLPKDSYLGGRNFPKHHNLPKEDLFDTIWCTRANLEVFVRKHILETYPGIKVVTGTVTSLKGSNKAITGVAYTQKGLKNTSTMDASLVVDCTGHSKAGAKWLEHLGTGPIPQVSYDPLQRYTSVWFKVSEEDLTRLPIPDELRDLELYLYVMEDPSVGGGLLWASKGENGIIGLSFGGFGSTAEHLPKTPEELKDFYRRFRTFDGKPLDDWYCDLVDFLSRDGGWERATYEECKIPPCVYVKYHEVASKLPRNFVALGDAVMRASPVYGTGITKGTVGVVTLAGALDRVIGIAIPETFATDLMISQNTRTGWLWDQSKEADYGYDTTIPCKGETLAVGAMTRAITKEFFHLTTTDEEARADSITREYGCILTQPCSPLE